MKLKIAIPILLLAIIIGACQKDVTIEIPLPKETPLFIEGLLVPGRKPQIYVSQSNAFFSKSVSPQEIFARGAEVKISSAMAEEILKPDSSYNKFRCRWEPFYGGEILPEHGNTYTLEVKFKGETYTASTTINQRAVEIKSIEYTAEFFDIYGGHDGVIIIISDHEGVGDNYRFQMDRMIDNTVLHAHALDGVINTCTQPGELFSVTDNGRVVYGDNNADGQSIEMYVEVSYEYKKDDEAWVFIQSLDKQSAEFYKDLDRQLVAILNPFVEPVFIETKIEGAMGVFGSAVLSDSLFFVYPQDNP